MKARERARVLLLLICAVSFPAVVCAQDNQPAQQRSVPTPAAPILEVTQLNPSAPCLQPPPIVRWEDYEGPFKKVVGAVGRRLERKSVGTPQYQSGTVLCSLTLRGKFQLFAADTFDPITFVDVAFNSGLDQARNNQPAFGQGAAGYGKRFGYSFSGEAAGEFFSVVVYSTIFAEDPRYYRLAYGSFQRRFFHAVAHTVVAKRTDGANEFNFCEWLGVISTSAVLHAYHTGRRRNGIGPAAEGISISIAQDTGWNVLREFWPEVAHKFKLPFRDENQAQPAVSR